MTTGANIHGNPAAHPKLGSAPTRGTPAMPDLGGVGAESGSPALFHPRLSVPSHTRRHETARHSLNASRHVVAVCSIFLSTESPDAKTRDWAPSEKRSRAWVAVTVLASFTWSRSFGELARHGIRGSWRSDPKRQEAAIWRINPPLHGFGATRLKSRAKVQN